MLSLRAYSHGKDHHPEVENPPDSRSRSVLTNIWNLWLHINKWKHRNIGPSDLVHNKQQWQSDIAYERLQIRFKLEVANHLLLLCYWAYLFKCLEWIMPPYFILLHIAQMAIRSNKYSKCIAYLLPKITFVINENKDTLSRQFKLINWSKFSYTPQNSFSSRFRL